MAQADRPGIVVIWGDDMGRNNVSAYSQGLMGYRTPNIFNLRLDPFERADITFNTYDDWLLDHALLLVPAQDYVGAFLQTSEEFPPRQKAASSNLDEVMRKLQESGGSK